jgi:leucyl-tRNA synthetase
LANDEVIDGKSERGGHPVIRVPMKQWMLKITDYAERLLEGLDRIDWPERAKEGQRNWIGKSEGASVRFQIAPENRGAAEMEVFTTRPDTIFGVTFMVLAPEHPLVAQITTQAQRAAVDAYVAKAATKSEVERKADTEKTGVWTGGYALNPLLDAQDPKAKIPVWIADYVLMDYGTGAIMAVPGHDSRDFAFAQKFNLPIVRVLESTTDLPFEGDGKLVNSDFLNGLSKPEAIQKAIAVLERKKLGSKQVQYKLRDWLFSRQRYWGEPFPIVEMEKSGLKGVAYDELPVLLPPVADYEPTEKGEPPLARVPEFVNYTDPKTGEKGKRITDTMPGSAGSSWYFLRYTDPRNDNAPFAFERQKYWMPVDLYVGGPEHTVGHLLYARFWQKVLFDCGLVSHDEPIMKLAHQGTIIGPDGFRMSKSRGNVVNPYDVRDEYGVDATRMYISFLGPFDKDKPWATTGITGVHRFLDRCWRQIVDQDGKTVAFSDDPPPEALNKLLHKTIKKVGADLEALSFNTAISALMILMNEINGVTVKYRAVLKPFVQLLAPLAPHMAEELWQRLGGEGFVALAPWPAFDKALAIDDVVSMGVQVNGKTRGTIEISPTATEDVALELARGQNSVKNAIDGKKVAKVIYKAGKILNIIVESKGAE